MDKIRILLADDHNTVRQELKSYISTLDNMEIVGEACDGIEAIKRCEELNPDLLIMDIVMPKMHGLDATRIITKRFPNIKIILLTLLNDEEYAIAASKNGAKGFILKDALLSELTKCIQVVICGGRYFKPSNAQILDGKEAFVLSKYKSDKDRIGQFVKSRESLID